MTDQSTAPLLTGGILARAAATGLAGAALSVDRHPSAVRRVGLVTSAGLGVVVALGASGVIPLPRPAGTDERPAAASERSAEEPAGAPMSPAAAAAAGAGIFALAAGASELGLRGQRRVERWAARTTGRPRLIIGVLTGALSLGIDLAERAASRRQPGVEAR